VRRGNDTTARHCVRVLTKAKHLPQPLSFPMHANRNFFHSVNDKELGYFRLSIKFKEDMASLFLAARPRPVPLPPQVGERRVEEGGKLCVGASMCFFRYP